MSAHEEAGAQALEAPAGAVEEGSLRLDKWLWYARFFKSRSLAARLAASGKIRRNSTSVHKAHQAVRPGDVLTFPQGSQIRVVKVLALGERRGPASEARLLYEDLAPAASSREETGCAAAPGERDPGSGRPTKRARRAIDRLIEDG
ncbi:MAG TPA: RNA-binding S4 domain-containing protein [Alphaproteobacteria bacterium]|nr:RNA-binding S4 domain-containing protein [Alphaproteobacteria bacterium]